MINVNLEPSRNRRDRRPERYLDRSPERAETPDRLTGVAQTLAVAMIACSVVAISHFIGLV